MKRFCIDTNGVISYITNRNKIQQEIIAHYFDEAANFKHEIVIIENVITELIYVMESVYNIEKSLITKMLEDLNKTPGIVIDCLFDINNLLKIWPSIIKEYGDALLAVYAKNFKIPIITFDKNFLKQLRKLKIKNFSTSIDFSTH